MQSFLPLLLIALYVGAEIYGYQALKTAIQPASLTMLRIVYWGTTALFLFIFTTYRIFLYNALPKSIMAFLSVFFLSLLIAKIIVLLFMFPEDLVRLARWGYNKATLPAGAESGISRSQFLSRAALLVAAVPAGAVIYGAVANPYNYRFRKVRLTFSNLPDAFNGFKIIQLSDIHSGSFTRKQPIIDVVNKINERNADLILFTGDLVNNIAEEMEPYMDVFDKLSAKLGVFSVMGNHDYGDYVEWESQEAKMANREKFHGVHKQMGWNLLLNQNHVFEKDGQKIALIGIENWGKGRFSKYGKMAEAYKGTEDIPFKILMSHDPSHWDAEVRPKYPDVDLTLSGHTHGAQMGIENKWLKWSPSEYIYKQWAGLYREENQLLYVNRGFGFIGYPGRIGILPEVTEIELVKA
jgi:predicted MPP superfamily phosphohydrolase